MVMLGERWAWELPAAAQDRGAILRSLAPV